MSSSFLDLQEYNNQCVEVMAAVVWAAAFAGGTETCVLGSLDGKAAGAAG